MTTQTSNLRGTLGSPYRAVKIILPLLSLFAFYATWGISLTDGTLNHMLAIRHGNAVNIPNTTTPLRLKFTGIPPIDYWFTIMVLFFWEAVDGSHPDTSLTGVYFLGQLIGVWALLWIEGLRRGNSGLTIASTVMWACLMHNFTLACFGGIFYCIYLSTSPTVLRKGRLSAQDRLSVAVFSSELVLLPFSLTLGYIIPSIFFGLPSPNVISYASHQAAIAVWTPFAVWVGVSQRVLSTISSTIFPSKKSSTQLPSDIAASSLCALRYVYGFFFIGSALVHIATVTISITAVLFPMIFAPGYAEFFHPSHLLFPSNLSHVDTIGKGVQNFMQWDQIIGYSSVLIWAGTMYWNGHVGKLSGLKDFILVTARVLLYTVLAGPGGAALALLWHRDERVLGELATGSQSRKGY
ncbi:hypothetical protein FQN57_006817 [Myotisia sp. PD_48]|nr:hypothetical protein FQN57_006817 [Myotisia sp. PD_48]